MVCFPPKAATRQALRPRLRSWKGSVANAASPNFHLSGYCKRNCTVTVRCDAVGFPFSMAGS